MAACTASIKHAYNHKDSFERRPLVQGFCFDENVWNWVGSCRSAFKTSRWPLEWPLLEHLLTGSFHYPTDPFEWLQLDGKQSLKWACSNGS